MKPFLQNWTYSASTKTIRLMPQNYMLASFAPGSLCSDGAVKDQADEIGSLMAAAPDMLETLQAAEHWLDEEANSKNPGSTRPDEILRVIRAAIAKAEGRA